MTTTTNPNLTHAELREEYRVTVRLWSEAKALYPEGSPEIASAEEQLAMLERQIAEPEADTSGETAVPAVETHG